ncbi:MAG: phage tail tape measure protein [Beijerinckiaceae bacterium]
MASDDSADGLADARDGLADIRRESDELAVITGRLSTTITRTFARGIVEGRRFEDMLQTIGKRMIEIGLRAGLKPLETALQGGLQALFSSNPLGGVGAPLNILPSAKGNVFASGAVTPFARGGVIGAPAWFPMQNGIGVMGERGAEAIMPLARGADGRLGVRANVASAPVSITVNIAAQDIESFRRSEAQIAGALSRAVARGRRAN